MPFSDIKLIFITKMCRLVKCDYTSKGHNFFKIVKNVTKIGFLQNKFAIFRQKFSQFYNKVSVSRQNVDVVGGTGEAERRRRMNCHLFSSLTIRTQPEREKPSLS